VSNPLLMKSTLAALLALTVTGVTAQAASIALNFSENNTNQGWLTLTDPIGPTNIPAGFFNTTNDPPGAAGLPIRTGSLASGSLLGLRDSAGALTTASVTWNSSNAWYSSAGTATDQARLGVGYLDDGGSGVSITFSNIPYAQYRVYGLVASDQGAAANTTYTTLDFTVNGTAVLGGTATAYKSIVNSTTATGSAWSLLTTSQTGNYWLSGATSGSTLTITAPTRSGDNRASIAGIVVEEIPEPSAALLGLGALAGLTLRRRRA
jgi:hypothetical protein